MDTTTLYGKLATIPAPIKSWLGSEKIVDAIGNMDQQFNLPSWSGGTIAKIIQRMVIKDLSPEHFSGQLALELSLDKSKVLGVVDEIKKTILGPIKKDLADYGIDISLLDKFEMLIMKPPVPTGPKIIQETAPVPMPIAGKPMPQPPTPKPPLSQTGWSTQKPIDLKSKPQPAPVGSGFQSMPQPLRPTPTPTPTPIPKTSPTTTPAPLIVQNTAATQPIRNAPDFHSPPGSQNMMSEKKLREPFAPKPAVLELGGTPAKGPVMIHYNDPKLPPQKIPVAEPGRQVSEITAGVKTITPPPAMAAKAAMPITPGGNVPMAAPIPKPTLLPKPATPSAPKIPQPPIPPPTPTR